MTTIFTIFTDLQIYKLQNSWKKRIPSPLASCDHPLIWEEYWWVGGQGDWRECSRAVWRHIASSIKPGTNWSSFKVVFFVSIFLYVNVQNILLFFVAMFQKVETLHQIDETGIAKFLSHYHETSESHQTNNEYGHHDDNNRKWCLEVVGDVGKCCGDVEPCCGQWHTPITDVWELPCGRHKTIVTLIKIRWRAEVIVGVECF